MRNFRLQGVELQTDKYSTLRTAILDQVMNLKACNKETGDKMLDALSILQAEVAEGKLNNNLEATSNFMLLEPI